MEQNQNVNYTESINLLKLKNSCIIKLRSEKTGVVKRGIFITIEENDLYESVDEALKTKAINLGIASWALREKGKYGDTHLLKQSFSKDFRAKMTEEELKNAPILGNMKPIERSNDVSNSVVPEISLSEDADLPF